MSTLTLINAIKEKKFDYASQLIKKKEFLDRSVCGTHAGDRFAASAEIDPTERSRPEGDEKDIKGETPLMIASEYGCIEIIEPLIQNGVGVNQTSNDGYTALQYACRYGHFEIVKLLIQYGADVNLRSLAGRSPLIYASINGNSDIVKYLLQYNANVNHYSNLGNGPLILASIYGHYEIVEHLLHYKVNINRQNNNGDTAFNLAITNYRLDVAKLLLRSGADPTIQNNQGKTYKDFGSEKIQIDHKEKDEITQFLGQLYRVVDRRTQPIDPDLTPLMKSAKNGNIAKLLICIEKSKNLDLQDPQGQTALHHAVVHHQFESIYHLLQSGASADIPDSHEKTPWDYALKDPKLKNLFLVYWCKDYYINVRPYRPGGKLAKPSHETESRWRKF